MTIWCHELNRTQKSLVKRKYCINSDDDDDYDDDD